MLVGFASAVSGVGGLCCLWRLWCRWSGSGCLCSGSLTGSGGSDLVVGPGSGCLCSDSLSGSGGSGSVVESSSDCVFGSGFIFGSSGSDCIMEPISDFDPGGFDSVSILWPGVSDFGSPGIGSVSGVCG